MTPLIHPQLVNDVFGDPALYVEFKFEKRALLIDLGEIQALEPRKILRLSDVFVSHAHMDHFAGFDRLLRVLLGRDKNLRLYGPEGFIDRVGHKLQGYTWNLVHRFTNDLRFIVTEIHSGSAGSLAEFHLHDGFRPGAVRAIELHDGVILDEETFRVRAAVLDHQIPSLAFAVEEKAHVNVWKDRLESMGLPVGPWLRDLKRAAVRGDPDDREVPVPLRNGAGERRMPLGQLKEQVLRIVPGQKIAYVVDAVFTEENARRIVELVCNADTLFIEATFARDETARAADRLHLTTAQAGALARRAGVRRLEPFHFSPRYAGEEARLRGEVEEAFTGTSLGAALTPARSCGSVPSP